MGGASGHLRHIHEDYSLTFGELKSILNDIATYRIDNVTEKFDGINLMFTWTNNGLRVARSVTDIKDGGLNASSLAKRLAHHTRVASTLVEAFEALNAAVCSLSKHDRAKIFRKAKKWYSIEVIDPSNHNVIKYDSKRIVFHDSPVFSVDRFNNVKRRIGARDLTDRVLWMQKSVIASDWKLSEPSKPRLRNIDPTDVVSTIEDIQEQNSLNDNDTVRSYVCNFVFNAAKECLDVNDELLNLVVDRVVHAPKACTLLDIKKLTTLDVYTKIRTFVNKEDDLLKKAIEPLELAIHDFAVTVLDGMKSAFVDDHDDEVARIRNITSKVRRGIMASHDPKANSIMTMQMKKLKSTDQVSTSLEGIVFVYNDKSYKLTGNFAPVNQILGIDRYDRCKVLSNACSL